MRPSLPIFEISRERQLLLRYRGRVIRELRRDAARSETRRESAERKRRKLMERRAWRTESDNNESRASKCRCRDAGVPNNASGSSIRKRVDISDTPRRIFHPRRQKGDQTKRPEAPALVGGSTIYRYGIRFRFPSAVPIGAASRSRSFGPRSELFVIRHPP